jgi:hypothetical protein
MYHKHPLGLIQPLPIPEWKHEVEIIDFIAKLPKIGRKHDSIMVVVDKLTKMSHFILVKLSYKETNIEKYLLERDWSVAREWGVKLN